MDRYQRFHSQDQQCPQQPRFRKGVGVIAVAAQRKRQICKAYLKGRVSFFLFAMPEESERRDR
jgi:hypothetical protein